MKHLYYAAGLIQAAGLGTEGKDLFVGTIPADAKRAVMLRDPLVGAPIDDAMKGFTSLEFQVVIRDPDPDAAYAKGLAISKVLKVSYVEQPDIYIRSMRATTLPISYPRGDADEIETSLRVFVAFALL
jgi:hypothetical protein